MTWDEGSPTIGRIYSDKLVETLGPAREPRARDDAATTRTSPRRCRSASRRSTSTSSRGLHESTGMTDLCLAGGVALNAVANGRIRPETPLRRALHPAGRRRLRHRGRRRVLRLEPGAPAAARLRHDARVHRAGVLATRSIAAAVDAAGLTAERLDDDALFRAVAERIAAGDVVGWFQGRMEFGPRALGNRSIVADPRRERHEGHPQRAHQAPRAVPAVRAVDPRGARPATGSTRTTRRRSWCSSTRRGRTSADEIPAVNHVDDTGRLQTVERDVEPRYYRLIEEFGRLTGRAGPAQHVVQRERADREDAGGGRRHVPQDAHGHARPRQLRRARNGSGT